MFPDSDTSNGTAIKYTNHMSAAILCNIAYLKAANFALPSVRLLESVDSHAVCAEQSVRQVLAEINAYIQSRKVF